MEAFQSIKQQLIDRYHNHPNNVKEDGIRLCVGVGLIFSILYDVWDDYLTIFPAIVRSMGAIATEMREDDTFWCKYWLIFALVKIIFDSGLPFLKASIPHFEFIKVIFFYYCGSYRYQGAKVIYNLISPFLLEMTGLLPNPPPAPIQQ